MEDLQRLVYTEMILKESMRLYPPVYLLLREPLHDLELGGYRLQKGQMLLLCPYMLHRDERNFPEPDRFDPERFRAAEADAFPKGAYIPFGAGPHQCIGREFGMMEATIILAAIVQGYDFSLAAGQHIAEEALITLRPHPGVVLEVTRSGAQHR